MKLIVGLGNPGPKHKKTRHNVGFLILDKVREYLIKSNYNFSEFLFDKSSISEISEGKVSSGKVLLIKPQTYMNTSGKAVMKLIEFYKLDPKKDLIVIYDDIDIAFGDIRTRGESSAGHKGMQSIIDFLKTSEIKRVRVGILGKEKNEIEDVANYVLEKFRPNELDRINDVSRRVFSILSKDFLKI
jgi:PTH1 family peptidyl-tRNA hydrolase